MPPTLDLDAWAPFLAAEAGAAATLAGLLFVGVSLNLTKILSARFLPLRSFLALTLLVAILVLASALLIPDQTLRSAGWQILVCGSLVWLLGSWVEWQGWRHLGPAQHRATFLSNVVLLEAATLPYLVGGILLIGGDTGGLTWFSTAIVFSFIKAVVDSWVLLVEINR
jgi:modulator of FtsH protease